MKRVFDAETFHETDTWAGAVLTNAEKNGGVNQDEDAWRTVRLA